MNGAKLNFLRIGSRSSTFRKLGISDNVRLLNEVIKGGLPVPASIVLLNEGWERMLADGIVEIDGENVIVQSADEFVARFALNGVRKEVVIHATTINSTKHNVPPTAIPLIEAIIAVWQASRHHKTSRDDILIMEAVSAQRQGTVISRQDAPVDVISDALSLPKLSRWQRPTQSADWQRRLQLLLRGVRRTLSLEANQDWELSWADDGSVCWVVGIRPIVNQ